MFLDNGNIKEENNPTEVVEKLNQETHYKITKQ